MLVQGGGGSPVMRIGDENRSLEGTAQLLPQQQALSLSCPIHLLLGTRVGEGQALC